MKKLLLLVVNAAFVLMLTACTRYNMTYEFVPAEQVVGASLCYVEGTDVRVTPVVNLGYTIEDVEEDSRYEEEYYYPWLLEEISYTLYKEDDSSNILVKEESFDVGYSEDEYIDSSYYEIYDYYPLYETEDPFNFGSLPTGNYQFSFTTISKYIKYKNVFNVRDRTPDKSQGIETDELTTTVNFTVSEYCGEIEGGYIVFEEHYSDSEDLNYDIHIQGFNKDGSQLTPDDIIIIDHIMQINYDHDYDYLREKYPMLSPLDDVDYIYLTSELYYDDEYYNYYYSDDSVNFKDKYGSQYYDTLNFDLGYFDLNHFNGYSLNYLYENAYGTNDAYITINIKGTNIYQDVRVLFGDDTSSPEFLSIPLDQVIDEGETLDLLDLGLTAFDTVDGDVTDKITVDVTDTSVLPVGEHMVTYTVTDFIGNTNTIDITLTVLPKDTETPVITVDDTLSTEFKFGTVLPDFTTYFAATDNRDGNIDITQSMLSWSPEFDANTPGTYLLTVTVVDKAMNEETETIAITILAPDAEPVFSNIPSNQIITEGKTLDLLGLGLTASDEEDGDLTSTIAVNIPDTSVLTVGDHIITYIVSDSAGNSVTTTIIITVIPDAEPVFGNIPTNQIITEGKTLDLLGLGLTASDEEDGDLTSAIAVNIPDTSVLTVGDHTVTYIVSDSAGNSVTTTITITITVIPDADPVFGNIPINQVITEGETLDLLGLGLTASDEEDGDLTSAITVSITDTSVLTVGDHMVTYTVTDSAENSVTTTITLTVLEATSPYSGAVVLAIALEPYVIDVAFDVDMLNHVFADPNAFVVVVDGLTATTTDAAISIDGLSVTLTIDEIISLGSIVTVSYQRTGINDLLYGTTTLVPEFQNVSVDTNSIASGGGSYTGGVMVASAFDANTIEIVFDVDTFDNSFLDETAFTVTINGIATTITGSFVNINAVTLNISGTMDDFTLVEVSYQATGNSDLSYGGVLVPNFSNEVVLPPSSGPMGPF